MAVASDFTLYTLDAVVGLIEAYADMLEAQFSTNDSSSDSAYAAGKAMLALRNASVELARYTNILDVDASTADDDDDNEVTEVFND